MAKLIITRSSEWMNRARGIKITINDKEIGKIANGQTREVELPPGDYVLKARVDWCGGSFLFTISGDETKEVMLASFGYSWNFMPISIAFTALVFVLQFLLKLDYAVFLYLPVLILMVYYLTIGRNSYLVIKEQPKSPQ